MKAMDRASEPNIKGAEGADEGFYAVKWGKQTIT